MTPDLVRLRGFACSLHERWFVPARQGPDRHGGVFLPFTPDVSWFTGLKV